MPLCYKGIIGKMNKTHICHLFLSHNNGLWKMTIFIVIQML